MAFGFAAPERVIRMEVLDHHKLKAEHFESVEKALDAADKMIAHQRTFLEVKLPDMILGDRLLDQFWYCKHQGTLGFLF